ncbi:MFS transporter [bacterium CPR1]|nr:MFS transporter [bacterium CPR1]
MSRPLLRRLWAVRAFYALCLCQLLSIAGLEMGIVFLPAYFADLGVQGSADILRWTALANLVTFLASLLCTPLWGRLGDRIGHKKMLMRAHLGMALALAFMSCARTPLEAVLARVVHGALAGLTPAAMALVSDGRRSARRISWVQTSVTAGAMVGPLLGSFLLAPVGASGLYLAGAVIAALSAAMVGWLARETPRAPASPRSGGRVSWLGPASLAAWVLLWRSLEDTVLPVYLQEVGGANWALWVGVALTGSRLAAMLATPVWGLLAQRFGSTRMLAFSLVGAGCLTLAQLMASSLAVLGLVRFLLGALRGGILPCLYSASAEAAAPDCRGQAIAWTASGVRLGKTLGNLAAPVLVVSLGFSGLFACMGLGLLLALPALPRLLRAR